jgi:hypothetical protein
MYQIIGIFTHTPDTTARFPRVLGLWLEACTFFQEFERPTVNMMPVFMQTRLHKRISFERS